MTKICQRLCLNIKGLVKKKTEKELNSTMKLTNKGWKK